MHTHTHTCIHVFKTLTGWYGDHSIFRKRTAPRKVLCSQALNCRRVLGRRVSLISSNPCIVCAFSWGQVP